MRVKAATCREQEARQLDLAANDPLESRRTVAAAAAKAWGSRRFRPKNAKPATSARATSSTRRSRPNLPMKTPQTRCRAAPDMELRLIIAYSLIVLLVGGLSAVVIFIRKKNKRKRGEY